MPASADSKDTLLICDDFFGYAKEIKRALEARGRKVIWFADRYSTDAKAKAALRLAPWLVAKQTRAHFDKVVESVKGQPIRDVLVIKGETVDVDTVKRLRAALPNTRFTLFFWDSYRNMPAGSENKVDLFDRAFTFDPVDAAKDKRLALRPLFYLDEYASLPQTVTDIDVLFFGTIHSDRYAVLSRLDKALPSHLVVKKVMYCASRSIYNFRRVVDPAFWHSHPSELVFKPVPRAEIMSLMCRAKVIVDIERAIQTGLTIRTLEVFGASKKLITTNPRAVDADFYNPANVQVIDRFNPKIDDSFFSKPYQPVPEGLKARYSLSGWLDEVLPD